MDFDLMEQKCQTNQYRIVEEFRADALLIVHNTVIYHGPHGNMADLARQMFRDCTYDLKEIAQCRDCYRYAVENPTKYWFCKPCRPFHELVKILIGFLKYLSFSFLRSFFRFMPGKKDFHFGQPKSCVFRKTTKKHNTMFDFLVDITKEL